MAIGLDAFLRQSCFGAPYAFAVQRLQTQVVLQNLSVKIEFQENTD